MTDVLAARFSGVPCMVAPEMQEQFSANLRQLARHPKAEELLNADCSVDDDGFWPQPDAWQARYRPYSVDANGILHIPVKGVLLHDFPWAMGWATGYDYIWRAFKRGVADGNVKGIALVENSPGGEVAGCFELVDKMFALRGAKPVRAFAATNAYSAAYAIFSVADQGVVARTGGVGSIGVVTGHMDVSQAMEKAGYKITFIFAGKHKVDGNPYEALPADVKARIQERIDALYDVFVSTVARNRELDEQAVRDTEALTFTADQAVSNGLADSIGALDDALAAFAVELSNSQGDDTMSQDTNGAVDRAAHEAAVNAARTEGEATGRAAGLTEGAAAAQLRIAAILDSDEAKDRPAAARMLAFDTDKDEASARASLAKLPVEKPAVAAPAATETATDVGDRFTETMNNGQQPNAGAGDNTDAAAEPDDVALARAFGMGGLRSNTQQKDD